MRVQTNGTEPNNSVDTLGGKGIMTISEAFEAYRQVCVFKNQSPKTEEHLMCAKTLLLAFFGDIEIVQLNFNLIRLWKKELEKRRSVNTVRGYIIKLRVVLKYCKQQGLDVVDPEQIPVPQRPETIPEFISGDDVQKLINASSRLRTKAIISLLFSSGLRVGELCNLNRIDIHERRFALIGKGGKARACFVDNRTDKLLKKYLRTRKDNHPALFLSQTGVRISATNVQLAVRIAAKNAGLAHKRIHPHTLRHSFATELMKNGMHIYKIQRLMGHQSIQTTQMYLHVADMELAKDYRKYHKT